MYRIFTLGLGLAALLAAPAAFAQQPLGYDEPGAAIGDRIENTIYPTGTPSAATARVHTGIRSRFYPGNLNGRIIRFNLDESSTGKIADVRQMDVRTRGK